MCKVNKNGGRTLRELLLGGPGLNGYAYNADVYCPDCGRDIIRALYAIAPPAPGEDDDSESWPCPIFSGESPDVAQHCGDCGEYLYGSSPNEEEPEPAENDENADD